MELLIQLSISKLIWNRHGHECSRIWKLSGNFTLIQCIKKCRDFLGRNILGTTFFRAEFSLIQSRCRSFIRVIVPYEISKVNFRVVLNKNWRKQSVSLWKEENVMLKEKHLHAKYQALFQLCFTKFSQKKYTYQMLLSSKTKKYFQKWFF